MNERTGERGRERTATQFLNVNIITGMQFVKWLHKIEHLDEVLSVLFFFVCVYGRKMFISRVFNETTSEHTYIYK